MNGLTEKHLHIDFGVIVNPGGVCGTLAFT